MVAAAIMAVWLAGAVPAEAGADSAVYHAARPVVEVIHAKPAPQPAPDRYLRARKLVITVLLAGTVLLAVYLAAQKHAESRGCAPAGRAAPSRHPSRHAPEKSPAGKEHPGTPAERARSRRDRRAEHAAEVTRLLRRI